ncbi:MAG TPA: protein kinase [Thermoanaerobaculia bacterium]|nr:protein kinase [Thermoanaerobaculia bacterium]
MLAPDQMLGAYKLIARVGAGGMGEVWKAEDTRLGRTVAVKILPSQVASDPEAVARMRREARTAAGLYHPNIATIHSFEEAEGQTFIVMEFVDGEPLSHVIARGPLPESEVCRIGRGVAEALAEAHEQGIVHRDIKPDNIIVRGQRVKVLDFGIAKRVGAESISSDAPTSFVTQQGMILGTVHYMSPEQALGKPLDARTDLFSLGIVLYEAATGKLPFRGETVTETITRIVRDEPEPPRVANPSITPALALLIERCLRKDREQRIGSAKELSTALERLSAVAPTEPMTAAMTAPMVAAAAPTIIERAPVQKPRHKWPLYAIILGPLLVLAIAYAAIVHRDRQQLKVTAPVLATETAKPSTSTMAVTAAPATQTEATTSSALSRAQAAPPARVVEQKTEQKPETGAGEAAGAPPSTPPPPTPVTPTAEQLYAQGLDAMVNRNPQEARRLFTDAIRADPHNAKAHFRLGEIALLNRNFDHSSDQFNRALANAENLDPREHALCDLGLAIGRDDRPEANRIARDIREQYPNDPDLAAIHRQFGAFFGKIDEQQREFPRRRRFH